MSNAANRGPFLGVNLSRGRNHGQTESGASAGSSYSINPMHRNSHGVPTILGSFADSLFGTGDPDIPGGPAKNQRDAAASWHRQLSRTAPEDLPALIDNLDSAISWNTAIGKHADAAVLQHWRDQIPGAGGGKATDFSTGEFDPLAAQSTFGLFNTERNRRTGVHPSQAAYNASVGVELAHRQKINDENYFNTQIDPALQSAQTAEQGLLDTPTYGYDAVSQMRSQSGALIKDAAENRAKSLGSLFGMSGLSAGSPALTAIGESAARSSDDQLQQALSQITQNTTQANRAGRADAAAGLSAISTNRLSARQGVEQGNRSQLYGAMNNLNGIQAATEEAKRQRDYQTEQANAAQDAQRRANYIKYGTAAVGLIAAPFTGGASLAALGGLAAKNAGGGASSPYTGAGTGYDPVTATPTDPYGNGYGNFLSSANQATY